jgi:hypothetical protein
MLATRVRTPDEPLLDARSTAITWRKEGRMNESRNKLTFTRTERSEPLFSFFSQQYSKKHRSDDRSIRPSCRFAAHSSIADTRDICRNTRERTRNVQKIDTRQSTLRVCGNSDVIFVGERNKRHILMFWERVSDNVDSTGNFSFDKSNFRATLTEARHYNNCSRRRRAISHDGRSFKYVHTAHTPVYSQGMTQRMLGRMVIE